MNRRHLNRGLFLLGDAVALITFDWTIVCQCWYHHKVYGSSQVANHDSRSKHKLRSYHQSHIYLHPPISCRHVVPKSDCERSPWEMEMRHGRFLPWVVSKCDVQTKDWRFLFQVVVSNIFYFHPYLGKSSNLLNIFQRGWNHQLVFLCWASELFHMGWSNWFHAIQAGVEWIALDSHEESYNLKQEGCCHQATGNTCEKFQM